MRESPIENRAQTGLAIDGRRADTDSALSQSPLGRILHQDEVKARLSRHRALIIEDDAASFGRMFMSLAAAGCRSTLARIPAQAFQMAARTPPTLVIFSTTVAGGAAALVSELRREPATTGAVLVALGSGANKRERRRILQLGCDGYLDKPADRFLFATELLLRTPPLMRAAAGMPPDAAPL